MFIDTHCHLYDECYGGDTKKVIETAKEHNVKKFFCVAENVETSKKVSKIASENQEVYAIIGIHPEYANLFSDEQIEQLRQIAKEKKVVGIGEIGLDYHYTKENKQKQIEMFEKQIELAGELNLPIIIHTRDAIGDTMEILQKNKDKLKRGGIIHCFHESKEVMDMAINLGFYIAYGGTITFKNANSLREIVQKTPLDRILTETDCPFLAPEPFRGTVNEPKNIDVIIQKMAEIKGVEVSELEQIIEQNTKRLFGI